MESHNRKNNSPLVTMSSNEANTPIPSHKISSSTALKLTPIVRVSPSTQQCKGISNSTGRPCKRTVASNLYCYQHKDQIAGENIFGIPTTPKKNNLSKNDINCSEKDVIDLSTDSTEVTQSQPDRQEKLCEIENRMKSLSLNNKSKMENNESGSTMITIKLNKLKVEIKETEESSTSVSISSEDNRERTPPPIRSNLGRIESTQKKIISSSAKWVQTETDIVEDNINKLPPRDRLPIESPSCIDDSFLETANKELFQTPNLVTPSNELILAPLLSTSPSHKSPLDPLFEIFNSGQKTPCKNSPAMVHMSDRKSPLTPTPTRTRTISCINTYESHVSITPGSITPTRSRNQTDLTGDYDSPSSYNSPSNLCQGRIKNGKICNRRIKPSEGFCGRHKKEFIEPIEEELEKAVFVPGRARLTYLRFGDWIRSDLTSETRSLLRSEMEKPISDKDEPGFIYAYRLLKDPNSEKNSYTLYKVGRSTNVHRRLYQWSKQCGYIPKLIELFPKVMPSSQVIDGEENENSSSNFEKNKCKYTHRAERLIHIELGARFKADVEKCKNCGYLHREWFKVQSLDSSDVMHGWEEVRKVIIHWISYVERVYGVG